MTAALQPKQKPSARASFDANALGNGIITVVFGLKSENSLREQDIPIDEIAYFSEQDYRDFGDGDIRYGSIHLKNGKQLNIFHECGLKNLASVIRHMIMRARAGQYAHYKDYNQDGTLKDGYEALPHRPDPHQASKYITKKQKPAYFSVNHKPRKGR